MYDRLLGTDVVGDMFDSVYEQYRDGWIPKTSGPDKQVLEHIRSELYKHQVRAAPKKRMDREMVRHGMKHGFHKCVFVLFAKTGTMWVYVKAYFNPAAANLENKDIVVQPDGWITHPKYANLRMGVYQ